MTFATSNTIDVTINGEKWNAPASTLKSIPYFSEKLSQQSDVNQNSLEISDSRIDEKIFEFITSYNPFQKYIDFSTQNIQTIFKAASIYGLEEIKTTAKISSLKFLNHFQVKEMESDPICKELQEYFIQKIQSDKEGFNYLKRCCFEEFKELIILYHSGTNAKQIALNLMEKGQIKKALWMAFQVDELKQYRGELQEAFCKATQHFHLSTEEQQEAFSYLESLSDTIDLLITSHEDVKIAFRAAHISNDEELKTRIKQASFSFLDIPFSQELRENPLYRDLGEYFFKSILNSEPDFLSHIDKLTTKEFKILIETLPESYSRFKLASKLLKKKQFEKALLLRPSPASLERVEFDACFYIATNDYDLAVEEIQKIQKKEDGFNYIKQILREIPISNMEDIKKYSALISAPVFKKSCLSEKFTASLSVHHFKYLISFIALLANNSAYEELAQQLCRFAFENQQQDKLLEEIKESNSIKIKFIILQKWIEEAKRRNSFNKEIALKAFSVFIIFKADAHRKEISKDYAAALDRVFKELLDYAKDQYSIEELFDLMPCIIDIEERDEQTYKLISSICKDDGFTEKNINRYLSLIITATTRNSFLSKLIKIKLENNEFSEALKLCDQISDKIDFSKICSKIVKAMYENGKKEEADKEKKRIKVRFYRDQLNRELGLI